MKALERQLSLTENNYGSTQLVNADLENILKHTVQLSPGAIQAASAAISHTVMNYNSIDECLHFHRLDKELVRIGKCAIAFNIMLHSRQSPIYALIENDQFDPSIFKIYNSFENLWQKQLVRMLISGRTASEIEGIFESVAFVIFNYDISLEIFLYYSLRAVALLQKDRALEIMSSLRVYHPYGSVCDPPWPPLNGSTIFGAKPGVTSVAKFAEEISTLTETLEDAERDFSLLSAWIGGCRNLIFLGFGYHEKNMEILSGHRGELSGAVNVLGTSMGIRPNDVEIVINSIKASLKGAHYSPPKLFDVDCEALMEENRMRISQMVF